jgi:dihydroxyacetone kinase
MERAIGYQDAGATSVYLIFQGMREFVERYPAVPRLIIK